MSTYFGINGLPADTAEHRCTRGLS